MASVGLTEGLLTLNLMKRLGPKAEEIGVYCSGGANVLNGFSSVWEAVL
jgi:hypothetical protein